MMDYQCKVRIALRGIDDETYLDVAMLSAYLHRASADASVQLIHTASGPVLSMAFRGRVNRQWVRGLGTELERLKIRKPVTSHA